MKFRPQGLFSVSGQPLNIHISVNFGAITMILTGLESYELITLEPEVTGSCASRYFGCSHTLTRKRNFNQILIFLAKHHLEQSWYQGQNIEQREIMLEAAAVLAK